MTKSNLISENLTKIEQQHSDEILDYVSEMIEKNDEDYRSVLNSGMDEYFSKLKFLKEPHNLTEDQVMACRGLVLLKVKENIKISVELFSLTKNWSKYPTAEEQEFVRLYKTKGMKNKNNSKIT